MKRKFKGFTLVECLVALAIIGIAGMMMAQIYAAVAQRNKVNHFVNTSLSNQMQYVEKYTNTEAQKISLTYPASGTTTTPPHKATGFYYMKITNKAKTTEQYSLPVDIYVLYNRDTKNRDKGDAGYLDISGSGNEDYDLRYKYLLVQ